MAPLQDVVRRSDSDPPEVCQDGRSLRRSHGSPLVVLLPILVGTLAFFVFRPALDNQCVSWGDEGVLIQTAAHPGFGPASLAWMFTNFHKGRFQPLTWLTFAATDYVWPAEPFDHHLVSLVLHIVNTVLLYVLALKLLTLAIPRAPAAGAAGALGAAAAAAVFAIHPLRVESVAWAAARSDVLSGAFYLAALLAYLRAHALRERGGTGRLWLAASLAAMTLSFLAGNSLATSVAVVVILDVYPLRRLGGGPGRWVGPNTWPVWREKLPFAMLAVVMAVVTQLARNHAIVLRGLPEGGVTQRILDSLFGLSLGIWKTLCPTSLSPLYGFSATAAVIAGVILIGTGALAWAVRRRWAGLLAAWLCYVIVLVPVLGLFGRNGYIAADRYTYIACLGWAVLFGGIVTWCLQAASGAAARKTAPALAAAALAVIIGLSYCTQQQCEVWYDSVRMWRHVLAVYPDCFVARLALGEDLSDQGNDAAAVNEFREAVRLCPANPQAPCDLGVSLYRIGDSAAAGRAFGLALDLDPRNDTAHQGLGRVLAERNEPEAALTHFTAAIDVNPDNLGAYEGMGSVLKKQGRIDAAIAAYRKAIRRRPDSPMFYSLAGNTLMDARRYGEAKAILQEGLTTVGSDAELANGLAWLMAVCPEAGHRDGKTAIQLAEYACRATLYQAPGCLDTLAAAYAEAGRFDDAIRTQKKAVDVGGMTESEQTLAEFRARLALFEAHRAYREEPAGRAASSQPAQSQPALSH
jgi:Flp pilus assembly protein TadD